MVEIKTLNGQLSTALIAIFILGIIGTLVTKPDIYQLLITGTPLAKYGLFLSALLVAFYEFGYPRINKALASGKAIEINKATIGTYLLMATAIVLGVITSDQSYLQLFMGNYYVQYGSVVYGILLVAVKIVSPRYAENTNETIIEPPNPPINTVDTPVESIDTA